MGESILSIRWGQIQSGKKIAVARLRWSECGDLPPKISINVLDIRRRLLLEDHHPVLSTREKKLLEILDDFFPMSVPLGFKHQWHAVDGSRSSFPEL